MVLQETGGWRPTVSPQARALRRVVRLNEEIGYQIRRLMGLNETDYSAMSWLVRGPLGPTDLARALHVTTASATTVVDRLVRAGHAVREPHEQDRRRMTVRAVENSREEIRNHVVPMMDMVEEELALLDEPGRAAVLQFLSGTAERMETHLSQLREQPAQGALTGSKEAGT